MKTETAGVLLKKKGLRCTDPRVRTLDVILAGDRPLSHAEIEERLEPRLDRVTLYRVLNDLAEAGLLRRITTGAATRFGASDHAHAHFTCDACGITTCLETVPVPRPALPMRYVVEGVELNLSGLCPGCSNALRPDEPEVEEK
ncbi:MAG TPA: Fur family transcriptional regulator [bacterium]|nr:Fur family transcriptional regulator [bacterium]